MKDHYAFVDYENHDSAVAAIDKWHQKEPFVNGEILDVKQSSMYKIL